MQPKSHGVDSKSGHHLFSLGVASLRDLQGPLVLPSQHFVAFVACDSSGEAVDDIADATVWLMDRGAVVVATWGPGCERFHDIVDEMDVEMHPDADAFVMTTWHDEESLAEALWFAARSIGPNETYEDTCNSVLAISIGNREWHAEIERWLASPDDLEEATDGGEKE